MVQAPTVDNTTGKPAGGNTACSPAVKGPTSGSSLQAQRPPEQAGEVVAAQQAEHAGQSHASQAEAELLAGGGEAVDPAQGAAPAAPCQPKAPHQPTCPPPNSVNACPVTDIAQATAAGRWL